MALLHVQFTAHNTVRGKRPYTIYEIEVRTSSVMPWLLYKRYSDFDVLHQRLERLKTTQSEMSGVQLPTLPPKILVRSRSDKVVKIRQRKLQQYMAAIVTKPRLLRQPCVLKFLEVPQSVTAIFARAEPTSTSEPEDSEFEPVPEFERRVNALLATLSHQKNRVKAIGDFDSWFFGEKSIHEKKKWKISGKMIEKLLSGEGSVSGLLAACRLSGSHSAVAWRTAIALLARLLDIERHEYAQQFRSIFCKVITESRATLKKMDLHKHIADGNSDDAFVIIDIIHKKAPALDMRSFLNSEEAWDAYQRWVKRTTEALTPFSGIRMLDSSEQLSDERMVTEATATGSSGDEDTVIHSPLKHGVIDWRMCQSAAAKAKCVSDLVARGKASIEDMRGWNDIRMPRTLGPLISELKALRAHISYKCEVAVGSLLVGSRGGGRRITTRAAARSKGASAALAQDSYKIRMELNLKHSAQKVFEFMKRSDLKAATSYDSEDAKKDHWCVKIEECKTVRTLDRATAVVNQRFKSANSPFTFTQFRTLRTHREEKRGAAYLMAAASVVNWNEAECKSDEDSSAGDDDWGLLMPSAVSVTAVDAKSCDVVVCLHLDGSSVSIVSADLLGETDEMFKSLVRLSTMCS